MKATHKIVVSTLLAATLTLSAAPTLAAGDSSDGPDAVVDLLFVRPFLILRTAIGAGLFVVSAPFTMASGDLEDVADTLVTDPAVKLFSSTRPGVWRRPRTR